MLERLNRKRDEGKRLRRKEDPK